jgi:co-chaperonin GroES (HSP10)
VNAPKQNLLNLKDGDEIIVHYLTFYDHSYEMHRGIMFGDERLWPISYYDVFAVIRDGELYPVGEYVIGDQVFEKEYTSSFLILPDGVGDKVNERQAIVLHTVDDSKIGLVKGDKVLLLPYANYKIEYGGKVYLRFRESEVIALCR